ncbi:B3 domain-containing protein [Tanacetum coccineum]
MGDSSKKNICFNCKGSCDKLMNGWKDSTGRHVQLCFNCCSIYKAGQFCEMFHSDEDGWRDCKSCKQLIHCGCIVSLSDYMINDSGGITCNDCSDTKSLLVRWELVSTTDSNLKTSRLIIPKKYALAHFPKVSGSEVVPLNIIDTEGQEWNFSLRCWPHPNITTYVITGLKEFYVSKNLQAGDIGTNLVFEISDDLYIHKRLLNL